VFTASDFDRRAKRQTPGAGPLNHESQAYPMETTMTDEEIEINE
jgi:hypothetical protein